MKGFDAAQWSKDRNVEPNEVTKAIALPRCDECNNEADVLYFFNGQILCKNCIKQILEKEAILVNEPGRVCSWCGEKQPVYSYEGREECIDCILEFKLDSLETLKF